MFLDIVNQGFDLHSIPKIEYVQIFLNIGWGRVKLFFTELTPCFESVIHGSSEVMMRIFVLVKQVPDTETRIKITGDKSGIDLNGIKWVVNPYDEFAIEEAVKTKETLGSGQVTVVTVGPKVRAVNAIRTAMAMGADDGILIDSPETLDLLTTSKAIARAIQKEGAFDAIMSGKLAIDDSSSAVSQMVAELLKLPHVVNANKIEKSGSSWKVEREIEGGAKEVYEINGAAVFGANKGLNKPRFASLPGIMKAKAKPVKELSLADLDLNEGAQKVRMTQFELPADRTAVKMIAGDADQQAKELARLLKEEAKVL